jgi:hypothetical protein
MEAQLTCQEPLHWFRRVHIVQGEPIEPNGLTLFACVRRFRHSLHRTEPRLDAELATYAFGGVAQETVECLVVLCCLADESLETHPSARKPTPEGWPENLQLPKIEAFLHTGSISALCRNTNARGLKNR